MMDSSSSNRDDSARWTASSSTRNIRLVSIEELDEENVNWGKLCMRILAIAVLISIIVCFAIGAFDQQFFLIAGIASGCLVAVLCLSFIDFQCLRSRYVNSYKSHEERLIPDEEVTDS